MAPEELTQLARAHYEADDWAEAFDRYRDADASGDLAAEDLERMGVAAWLIGEPAEALLGRACEAYESAGRPHDAARAALDLVDYHATRGELSRAAGWIRRASRTLGSAAEGAGHARLAIMKSFMAILSKRLEEALDLVDRGHALAREHADQDAEALALSHRGGLLLHLGRIEEATADVDEAMLLVHRDKVQPISGAIIYCRTIDFCRDLGDLARAMEWTEAAAQWTTQRRVCAFPGVCRVHRAELLRLRGEHVQAQTEVRAAIELFEQHRFLIGMGFALAELGQQHLEVDALDAARAAFDRAADVGHEPLPGAAELALRREDAVGARAMLETALDERADDPLGRARLLPTLVTACVELHDLTSAQAAADELDETARRLGTLGTQALAATARTRLHLASGEVAAAIRYGRSATRAWSLLGACFELAQSRELLARAYEAAGDQPRASLERERLGEARQHLSKAATLLATDDPSSPRVVPAAIPEPLPPIGRESPIREGVTLGDKIRIGPVIGIGGMGVVHASEHLITGRHVAVKVLKPDAHGEERYSARFLQEAKACGRIRHPNVVDIFDAGMHKGAPYIVMERLEGRSLEEMLDEGRQPTVQEALSICEQAARGLVAAHEADVIHRDLKPANIFLAKQGVKVLDFGISKLPEGGETKPGQVLGTPFYMAPEQVLQPERVDAPTDIYALGAVLFELLAGRPPHVADTIPALLFAITNGPEPDFGDEAPTPVGLLVRRAIARAPEDRFPSAAALADELARVREANAH